MTEEEWLECTDPKLMLAEIGFQASSRKLGLFACGCCRRLWHLFAPWAHQIIQDAERWVDGEIDDDRLLKTMEQAGVIGPTLTGLSSVKQEEAGLRRCTAKTAAVGSLILEATGLLTAADPPDSRTAWLREVQRGLPHLRRTAKVQVEERHMQAQLLRCIFGNPFRPVTISPAILAWNDAAVVRLAQAAYDERHLPEGTLDNGRLAVLADALEEAGCTDADILSHLRGSGPHVRGCWPVDLVLGKS